MGLMETVTWKSTDIPLVAPELMGADVSMVDGFMDTDFVPGGVKNLNSDDVRFLCHAELGPSGSSSGEDP
jgi:hypothetical protein